MVTTRGEETSVKVEAAGTIMTNIKGKYHVRDSENSEKRDCLRCGKLFLSEHIVNRLCFKCGIINKRF